jgi:hypothetical protein
MRNHYIRGAIAAAFALTVFPFVFAPAAEPASRETFTGKVVPLKGVLEKAGVRLDKDAAPAWLAFVTDDGHAYPLIKDEGGRMFFKDVRLLDRPLRISGKRILDGRLLQVLGVQSVRKGELYDVYYWCDICSIKRFEKQDCDCCGALMELRETPAKK